MTTFNVAPIALEGFAASFDLERDRFILRLSGTGDMAAAPHFERCLLGVHAEVAHRGLRTLRIDIQALYFLNSSCLKALTSLVYTIKTRGPVYQLEFLTDRHLTWQPRSLGVIQRLAPDIVSVLDGP